MASATDIITYIGVPLAVLGVLPILYTFILSFLTQRRIRHALLHHGHRPMRSTRKDDGFQIRSSPMTSLIEIELPRYTIAPLERTDVEYWTSTEEGRYDQGHPHHHFLARAESTLSVMEEGRVQGYLRGGSWRAFHWKRLLVGRKLYRIQYEDELREPPAEIDFGELVHFLLDWGAVMDPMGWEKLRSGGLWTPAGTVLLRKAGGGEEEDDEGGVPRKRRTGMDWVLRTTVPDESDGILSLTIRWPLNNESRRGGASLPPGWGRLKQPVESSTEKDSKRERAEQALAGRIRELKVESEASEDSTSFRFHIQDKKIAQIQWEYANVETGSISEPWRTYESTSAGMWFTCATSALLSRQQAGGLWGFEIPDDVLAFSKADTVPCGVMVLLGLMDESEVPQWSSEVQHDPRVCVPHKPSLHHQQFMARLAAEKLEKTMPPEQARVHKMNREAAARAESSNAMLMEMHARKERQERRVQEAIASPKLNNKAVAEACLTWLISKGQVEREWTVEQLAESVLYLMAVDVRGEGEAAKVVKVLDEWMAWHQVAGMRKHQVEFLENRQVEFCFAAALVAVLQQTATTTGKAGTDMLECLKQWRVVRLG